MTIVKAIKYIGGAASIIGGIIGVVSGVKDIREGSASDETNALDVSEKTTETEVIETQGKVVEPEETTEEE